MINKSNLTPLQTITITETHTGVKASTNVNREIRGACHFVICDTSGDQHARVSKAACEEQEGGHGCSGKLMEVAAPCAPGSPSRPLLHRAAAEIS